VRWLATTAADQVAVSLAAACTACHGFFATTPTVFLDDDLDDPGHAAHRGLIDAHQGRANRRWSHDTAVQHPARGRWMN
jgi:hypothetical protein